jgi:hypothetical protein
VKATQADCESAVLRGGVQSDRHNSAGVGVESSANVGFQKGGRRPWQGAEVPGLVVPVRIGSLEKGGGDGSEHEWTRGVGNNSPNENALTNV